MTRTVRSYTVSGKVYNETEESVKEKNFKETIYAANEKSALSKLRKKYGKSCLIQVEGVVEDITTYYMDTETFVEHALPL